MTPPLPASSFLNVADGEEGLAGGFISNPSEGLRPLALSRLILHPFRTDC